tara:strand:- start:1625 stop:1891 length:267 start_codon:yes stop_codon:yes gene_type:complete
MTFPHLKPLEIRHGKILLNSILSVKATFSIIGDESYEFNVTNETYADILNKINMSPNAVVILVDGIPVPYDSPVVSSHSEFLKVLSGG